MSRIRSSWYRANIISRNTPKWPLVKNLNQRELHTFPRDEMHTTATWSRSATSARQAHARPRQQGDKISIHVSTPWLTCGQLREHIRNVRCWRGRWRGARSKQVAYPEHLATHPRVHVHSSEAMQKNKTDPLNGLVQTASKSNPSGVQTESKSIRKRACTRWLAFISAWRVGLTWHSFFSAFHDHITRTYSLISSTSSCGIHACMHACISAWRVGLTWHRAVATTARTSLRAVTWPRTCRDHENLWVMRVRCAHEKFMSTTATHTCLHENSWIMRVICAHEKFMSTTATHTCMLAWRDTLSRPCFSHLSCFLSSKLVPRAILHIWIMFLSSKSVPRAFLHIWIISVDYNENF